MTFVAPRRSPVLTELDETQAGAVQNTWYVLANLKNCHLKALAMGVTVANETLECRINIDGTVFTITAGVAVTAAQWSTLTGIRDTAGTQTVTFSASAANADFLITSSATVPWLTGFLRGRTTIVEVRKTTATGASALRLIGFYEKW